MHNRESEGRVASNKSICFPYSEKVVKRWDCKAKSWSFESTENRRTARVSLKERSGSTKNFETEIDSASSPRKKQLSGIHQKNGSVALVTMFYSSLPPSHLYASKGGGGWAGMNPQEAKDCSALKRWICCSPASRDLVANRQYSIWRTTSLHNNPRLWHNQIPDLKEVRVRRDNKPVV
jgi:hypothetical protein